MKGRAYYRVELELLSALSVGAADSVETDCDLMLDSRGLPLIPATSLTGALRARLPKGDAVDLFGELGRDESAVRVYDGAFVEGTNGEVSVRDNVRLENRLAVEHLKFDREVANRGARFCTILEVVRDGKRVSKDGCGREGGEERSLDAGAKLEGLIADLNAGRIRLGAKKTRGLGRVRVVSCKRLAFDLRDELDCDAWLGFDPFDDRSWQDVEELPVGSGASDDTACLSLTLKRVGGSCVREYNTEPEAYDYRQLTIPGIMAKGADGREHEVAVIPGTSWAGAIRERYEEFDKLGMAGKLFGKIGPDGIAQSLISFDESVLEGGEWKTYTRNAIDRFTGGTLDTALFTQRGYFGGTTRLEIVIRLGRKGQSECDNGGKTLEPECLEPLVAALADLHNGFVAVGGLAAVGYGLFRITGVELQVRGQDESGAFAEAFMRPAFDDDTLIAPCVSEAARILAGEPASDNDKEVL